MDRFDVVYPGHPLVIAYVISKVYTNPSAALEKTEHNAHHALGSLDVPGAGGEVWAAIDVIKGLRDGKSPDSVLQLADHRWEMTTFNGHKDAYVDGQLQADEVKTKLNEILTWVQKG